MPNPKRGTVREDLDVAVNEAKGLMDWREDKQGIVRAGQSPVGGGVFKVSRPR